MYLLSEQRRYYVGESADVAARLLGHMSTRKFSEPRMVLLREVNKRMTRLSRDERRAYERRFMAAALEVGLPLLNGSKSLPSLEQIGTYGSLGTRLKEAASLLGA